MYVIESSCYMVGPLHHVLYKYIPATLQSISILCDERIESIRVRLTDRSYEYLVMENPGVFEEYRISFFTCRVCCGVFEKIMHI